MEVYWDRTKLPRTTTRLEWKHLYAEYRLLRKRVVQDNKEKLEMIRNLRPGKIRDDLIYEMINPPLLLGPGLEYR